MIVIDVALTTTAEQRDRCIAGLRRQMEVSRVEPGCVAYRVTADLEDPLTFRLLEIWENEASLGQHLKTADFAAFVAEMPQYGKVASSVARSGPLEPYTVRR